MSATLQEKGLWALGASLRLSFLRWFVGQQVEITLGMIEIGVSSTAACSSILPRYGYQKQKEIREERKRHAKIPGSSKCYTIVVLRRKL